MPTVIDLFCGAGGFSYGFKKAGYNILLGIDNESSKLKTYERNICCSTLLKDISRLTTDEIKKVINNKPIDVIIGSPPCTDYTPCNPYKKSKKDQESIHFFPLAYNFFYLVVSLKPKFFVMENVKEFYQSRDYSIIEKLFQMFGYNVSLNTINAKDFGVPQSRYRGFFIGSIFNNKVILTKPDNIKHVTLEEAIDDLKSIEPIQYYTLERQKIPYNDNYTKYQNLMHSKKGNLYIYNHTKPTHEKSTIEILNKLECGDYYGSNKYHVRSYPWDVGKQITSRFDTPSTDGETMHYELPRCLTLREAARLQSFDDDFIFIVENLRKQEIRKLIGDAVPPLISELIAKKLKEFL